MKKNRNSKPRHSDDLNVLHAFAVSVKKNSHSPYSHFKVGAALITEENQIFAGCNVENASYGGTICAERAAIFSAVSASGKIKIKDLVVVTKGQKPWPPCGLCRQVINEFATPKTKIHLADEKKIRRTYFLDELLPEAFGPENLKK